MMSVEVSALTAGYGTAPIVSDVSFSVASGEVLALVGPNAAGKTTLLRTLARSIPALSGEVVIQGRPLGTLSQLDLARSVSHTPQSERRDWPLSVREAVELGRAAHRGWFLPLNADDAHVVEDALQTTGLWSLRGAPITRLSGGEWRRMTLARAMAQQAPVMLVDEPIAGLDLKYQVEMLEMFREQAVNHQVCVLVTLHDLNLAAAYADRIAVLHGGRLEVVATPQEVVTAERVERVYETSVTVLKHPESGTPLVVPRGTTNSLREE